MAAGLPRSVTYTQGCQVSNDLMLSLLYITVHSSQMARKVCTSYRLPYRLLSLRGADRRSREQALAWVGR